MRRHWPLAAIVLGVILLAAGGYGLFSRHRAPEPVAHTTLLPAPIISPGSPADPAGTPAVLGTEYRVKVIEAGIDLPLVGGDGLTVPLYKAAVEPNMKLPGQGGRSLIYAHARDGMFGPLFNARVGYHVEVDRPGAPALHYTIRSYTRAWPATDASILKPADHEELVLLTCTTYDPRDPRIVAIATPD